MYKVGKLFMEEVKITIDNRGRRIVVCPICDEEVELEDTELVDDTVICEWCGTGLLIID